MKYSLNTFSSNYIRAVLSEFIRKGKNRTEERAVIAEEEQSSPTTVRTKERPVIAEEVREQFKYKLTEIETNAAVSSTIATTFGLFVFFLAPLYTVL